MERNLICFICLRLKNAAFALFVISIFYGHVNATTWQVGPTRTYTVPSAVTALVIAGDTVQIDSGTYTDCAIWSKSNLVLMGPAGSYAHCINSVCGYKGIWVINAGADNITIENMEFSGASISGGQGGNGAGLRAQGGSYTIRHCYFHNNQNGILCNPTSGNDSADVWIENSVFAYNGCPTGDASGCNPGYEHNMYIGSGYRNFTLIGSYSHGAIVGHNVKTRARNNYILYNSIMDLADGTSSYNIDIAQGGATIIMGNLIEGGPHKTNNSIICYNEGSTNAAPQNLYLINNTIVNNQTGGYFLFMPLVTNDTLTMLNNIIAGPGSLFKGNPGFNFIDSGYNFINSNIAAAGLVDAAIYNYQLTDSSPAIDAGTTAGSVFDLLSPPFSLSPSSQYVDSAITTIRTISGHAIDIGAYEFPQPTAITAFSANANSMRVWQNNNGNEVMVQFADDFITAANLLDMTGRVVVNSGKQTAGLYMFNTKGLSTGIYIAQAQTAKGNYNTKFVLAK